jgi:hypothetical protein
MSYHTNLRLRLNELERSLLDAREAAASALRLAEDEQLPLLRACSSLMMRLDEAQYNVTTALRHLEEEDHA